MIKIKKYFRRAMFAALAVLMLAMSACTSREDEGKTPVTPEPPPVTAPVSPVAPSVESPSEPSPQATPVINENVPTRLGETEDMGQEYIDKIIFLGDSTTYGLKHYAMLSDGKETTQVWTPSSGTLTISNQSFATIQYPGTGTEIPIRDAVKDAKPEMMVITLGVNGVSFLTEDGFKSEYKALVNDILEISPDTKIILQSIFPVQSDYKYISDINNTKITAANGWIEALAEECGVRYLDTYSKLVGSDGFLNKSYGNGDGIHLGPDGFTVELNNIRTHGYK